MPIRIGINGFGRIGRTILRAALTQKTNQFEIVHINDLVDTHTAAFLLKNDSVHGRLHSEVSSTPTGIVVNGKEITVSSSRSPAEIPWKAKSVDIVFECSGVFNNRKDIEMHLKAGAPKVLISAPSEGEDITVVFGVNSDKLLNSHHVVSNGSCTTNCLAPLSKVVHENFGIISGLMTTIHSYTNDQKILDVAHKDLRRARAAGVNMIPTSTGAARALGLVLPELKGKVDGVAVRVPTSNVSLVDVTFVVQKDTSAEEVNKALKEASEGSLKGILGFTMEPLVSVDYNGNPLSSNIDGEMTKVINKNLVKIFSWYDNETGFSHRMLDVAKLMTHKG